MGVLLLGLEVLVLTLVAGVIVWRAAARWWHYLVIGIGALPLFPPVAKYLTGDISPYVPADAFAPGGAGKDQFILVSIYVTILIAIIAAAFVFWAGRVIWERWR